MAVETGWMAAAETRVPDMTKALAEREASMDGKSGGSGSMAIEPTNSGLRSESSPPGMVS